MLKTTFKKKQKTKPPRKRKKETEVEDTLFSEPLETCISLSLGFLHLFPTSCRQSRTGYVNKRLFAQVVKLDKTSCVLSSFAQVLEICGYIKNSTSIDRLRKRLLIKMIIVDKKKKKKKKKSQPYLLQINQIKNIWKSLEEILVTTGPLYL
jgi:hypothetical protein